MSFSTLTFSAVSNEPVGLFLDPVPGEFKEALSFSPHSLEELETDPDRFLCRLRLRRLRDLSFSGFSTGFSVTADDSGGKLSSSQGTVDGGLRNKKKTNR